MRFTTIITLCLLCAAVSPATAQNRLWYDQPADEWMKALPLGNGRIGAMVFGGIGQETIALNEITMWSGQPDPFQERPLGREMLGEIRRLFFERRYAEGNHVAEQFMAGTPHSFGSHVPLGDLKIAMRHPDGAAVSHYHRELDLTTAVNSVSYRVGGVTFTREAFCSNPDDLLVVRLAASRARTLNFDLSLDLLRDAAVTTSSTGIGFAGKVSFPRQGPGGVDFAGRVEITVRGGKVTSTEGGVRVDGATEALIAVDIRTDFTPGDDPAGKAARTVEKALAQEYKTLKARHTKDHGTLYNRVELTLGKPQKDDIPTDQRWEKVKAGAVDPYLDALFFRYARYLQIAASRENSPLPANLQGLWNDNLAANMGWTNDYHLDINTQQNYWLANVGNLPETNAPLWDYLDRLVRDGGRTARNVYGARGWAANTVANPWGYTAAGSGVGWGLFPLAGVWLASHLWTHWLFTRDEAFLRERAWPVMRSSVEFLLDYMVAHPESGYLMTGPSTSPENSFRWEGSDLSLSMMPTSDRVLAHEALASFVEAARVLDTDDELSRRAAEALAKLPPLMIGSNGALQEWIEDFEEAAPNHRHTSHLLALYPFAQITPEATPDLADAAARTIELRLAAPGWEDVEWSRANMICFEARLRDAEKAHESVVGLQRTLTRENLLTISPKGIAGAPYDIFIYDGNQAGAAGIAEMLIQSHAGYIELLPALPAAWADGNFRGLCARGGAILDAEWSGGRVTKATITATVDGTFAVKITPDSEKIVIFVLNKGESRNLIPN